jgi:hypothetical protein
MDFSPVSPVRTRTASAIGEGLLGLVHHVYPYNGDDFFHAGTPSEAAAVSFTPELMV